MRISRPDPWATFSARSTDPEEAMAMAPGLNDCEFRRSRWRVVLTIGYHTVLMKTLIQVLEDRGYVRQCV